VNAVSEHELYGGVDPVELPIYAYAAASRYLDIPARSVGAWARGRLEDRGDAAAGDAEAQLGFLDLVEVYVAHRLTGVRGVTLPSVRSALVGAEAELGLPRLLLRHEVLALRPDGFVERLGATAAPARGAQLALRLLLEQCFARFDRGDDGLPVRFYPEGPGGELWVAQRPLQIDPRVNSGRPTIRGTGVDAAVVAGRHDAGESVEDLVRDYGVARALIEAAIAFEHLA
jgi:uncharacterized protein (DUF433 family)